MMKKKFGSELHQLLPLCQLFITEDLEKTAVEHLPYHPKIKGSSPAAAVG
jgi:hypothetical protein